MVHRTMRRFGLIFLLSSFAVGQGIIVPTQQALKVVNGVTSPVANATITVCAANASGIPCTPALVGVLFKDAALTQVLTNPFTSDANGNYVFAIAPGNYTVTVTGLGFSGYSYQTTAPLAGAANNTFTQTNTFTGPTNLNGGGSLTGTFGGPATFSGNNTFTGNLSATSLVSFSNLGLYDNLADHRYWTSYLNADSTHNPTFDFQNFYFNGTAFETAAVSGYVQVPSSGTQFQSTAIDGYCSSPNLVAYCVGGMFGARISGTNGHVIAMNSIAQDGTSGVSSPNIESAETDLNLLRSGSGGTALLVNGILNTGTGGTGIGIVKPGGTSAQWNFGINIAAGATIAPDNTHGAIVLNPITAGGGTNIASQAINFVANDPTSGQNNAQLSETAAGNIVTTNSKATTGFGSPLLFTGGAPATSSTTGDITAQRSATTGAVYLDGNGDSYVLKTGTPSVQIQVAASNIWTFTSQGNINTTGTIASGTATMTTAAIGAGACGTTVTVAAAGVATTDTIVTSFNAAPAGTNAGLTSWPTSGNVNFAYCPGVAETPAAATINWRVVR